MQKRIKLLLSHTGEKLVFCISGDATISELLHSIQSHLSIHQRHHTVAAHVSSVVLRLSDGDYEMYGRDAVKDVIFDKDLIVVNFDSRNRQSRHNGHNIGSVAHRPQVVPSVVMPSPGIGSLSAQVGIRPPIPPMSVPTVLSKPAPVEVRHVPNTNVRQVHSEKPRPIRPPLTNDVPSNAGKNHVVASMPSAADQRRYEQRILDAIVKALEERRPKGMWLTDLRRVIDANADLSAIIRNNPKLGLVLLNYGSKVVVQFRNDLQRAVTNFVSERIQSEQFQNGIPEIKLVELMRPQFPFVNNQKEFLAVLGTRSLAAFVTHNIPLVKFDGTVYSLHFDSEEKEPGHGPVTPSEESVSEVLSETPPPGIPSEKPTQIDSSMLPHERQEMKDVADEVLVLVCERSVIEDCMKTSRLKLNPPQMGSLRNINLRKTDILLLDLARAFVYGVFGCLSMDRESNSMECKSDGIECVDGNRFECIRNLKDIRHFGFYSKTDFKDVLDVLQNDNRKGLLEYILRLLRESNDGSMELSGLDRLLKQEWPDYGKDLHGWVNAMQFFQEEFGHKLAIFPRRRKPRDVKFHVANRSTLKMSSESQLLLDAITVSEMTPRQVRAQISQVTESDSLLSKIESQEISGQRVLSMKVKDWQAIASDLSAGDISDLVFDFFYPFDSIQACTTFFSDRKSDKLHILQERQLPLTFDYAYIPMNKPFLAIATKFLSLESLIELVTMHPRVSLKRRLQHGYTTLHIAAWNGRGDIVRYLLGQGVNPRLVNDHGEDAIGSAKQCRNKDRGNECVRILERWLKDHP